MAVQSSAMSLSSVFAAANRGPLTTIFTPPASCVSETTVVSYLTTTSTAVTVSGGTSTSQVSSVFTTTKIFENHFSWGDAACYPSTIQTVDSSTRWNNGYYYSPGICPSGWASACQVKTSAFGLATTLSADQSAVLCCPSQWSCVTTDGGAVAAHGCQTILSVGQTVTSAWLAPAPTPNVVLSIPTSRSLTNWVVPVNTTAGCDAIPVMWQNTDVQILALLAARTSSSSSSSSSSPSTSTQTSNAIPSQTGTPTDLPAPEAAGLSTGAKAAIGVTIPVALIAIVAGIFFFFRRRKNEKTRPHELDGNGPQSQEVTGGRNGYDARKKDLPPIPPAEADPDHYISELDSVAHLRQELPSYPGSPEYPLPAHRQSLRSDASQSSGVPSPDLMSASTVSPRDQEFNSMRKHSAPSLSFTAATPVDDGDDKLQILRARIERVRAEKVRLNQLNELEEMEEELKHEIMVQQNRVMRL